MLYHLGRRLELYDPTGTLINDDNGMEILLNLDSVLIATIKAPDPGIYKKLQFYSLIIKVCFLNKLFWFLFI